MRPDGPRDPVAGPDSGPEPPFPIKLSGPVIRGFGRGSKEVRRLPCLFSSLLFNAEWLSQPQHIISIPLYVNHPSPWHDHLHLNRIPGLDNTLQGCSQVSCKRSTGELSLA